jgi:hypothetical protein
MANGAVRITIRTLIEDLIVAVDAYHKALKPAVSAQAKDRHGSFEAFRDAFNEMFE